MIKSIISEKKFVEDFGYDDVLDMLKDADEGFTLAKLATPIGSNAIYDNIIDIKEYGVIYTDKFISFILCTFTKMAENKVLYNEYIFIPSPPIVSNNTESPSSQNSMLFEPNLSIEINIEAN